MAYQWTDSNTDQWIDSIAYEFEPVPTGEKPLSTFLKSSVINLSSFLLRKIRMDYSIHPKTS